VNTGDPEANLYWAERRVLKIQTKLYQWACADPGRRFDDLFNLVADPAFLLVAWDRVRSNRGARTAGVDRRTASSIERQVGVENFLDTLRSTLKDRSFRPLPLRERMIPKPGGKQRRLGIATITDRVVQAALKLVLEPIFEADFFPCSYGFRPNRRATTRWPRYATSPPTPTSGFWKAISKPVWMHRHTAPLADCLDQNRQFAGAGGWIRRPFRRPVRTCTAWSSPRLTRCIRVCRETP
jgi:RNA-directed DNA polymerase